MLNCSVFIACIIYCMYAVHICSLYFLTEQQLQRVKIVGPIVSRYPARYPSWFPPPWCRLSFCEIKRNLCPLQVVNSHCIVSFSNALQCTYFLLRFRFNLTSFPLHLSGFFPLHLSGLQCFSKWLNSILEFQPEWTFSGQLQIRGKRWSACEKLCKWIIKIIELEERSDWEQLF